MNEWSSPTLVRMAAEAVWDRPTYERLCREWYHKPLVIPQDQPPSRAMSHRGEMGAIRVYGRPGE